MFDVVAARHGGLLGLDSTAIDKQSRGVYLTSGAELTAEKEPGYEDHKPQKLVEPGNALFWKHTGIAPRGAWGSWSFGLPARHLGGNIFQPLADHATTDDDFTRQPVFVLGSQKVPVGADAVVFSTAGHGTHEKVAIVSGVAGPLVAHWRGNKPPEFSTDVHDIAGDVLDSVRKAGLDTVFEVRKWAAPCSGASAASAPEYTVALNGRASPHGKGFLHVSFGDHDALFSFMASGPLVPSFHAKHGLVHTGDAPLSAGAISTQAYFRGSTMPFTAPLAFEEEIYPPVQNGEIPYEVHRQYDPDRTHPFLCAPKKGLWREFVKLPVGETPPCKATKDYSRIDRSFAEDSRLFFTRNLQVAGVYFQPRPLLTRGR